MRERFPAMTHKSGTEEVLKSVGDQAVASFYGKNIGKLCASGI